jgi:SAM-dependent methyltransferase
VTPDFPEGAAEGKDFILQSEADLPVILQGESTFSFNDIYSEPDWYDADYAGLLGDVRFYRALAETADVVVELGAGTGRVTRQLLALSPQPRIVAVEPAAAMRVKLMAQLSAEHLDVVDATASTFCVPLTARSIIVFPFNGLLHLETRPALDDAFRHMAAQLPHGGRIAFDVTGPYWNAMLPRLLPWGRADQRVHPTRGVAFWTCDRFRFDVETRLMHVDVRYATDDGVRCQVRLVQKMWTVEEIMSSALSMNFETVRMASDLGEASVTPGTSRFFVVMKKR